MQHTKGKWVIGSLESDHGNTGIAFRRVYRPADSKAIHKYATLGPPWDVEPAKSAVEEARKQGCIEVNGNNCDNDAARIVACVNACAGLTNEQLSKGVVPVGVVSRAFKAALAAYNCSCSYARYTAPCRDCLAISKLHDALTKAEEATSESSEDTALQVPAVPRINNMVSS